MKDPKPLSLENKINKVSNLVQKFNDGELSYQGLDNELDELYALPSKGIDQPRPLTEKELAKKQREATIEDKGIVAKEHQAFCPGVFNKDTKHCICDNAKGMVEKETDNCDVCGYIKYKGERCGCGYEPKEASANKEFSGYQTEVTPGLEWDAAKEGSSADETKLVGEFDAKVWAKEFARMYPMILKDDEGAMPTEELMLGWFANAIMAGYDHHSKLSAKSELVELKNSTVRVFLRRRCPRSVPLDDKEIDSLSEDICSAFGTKPSVPSIEEIYELLHTTECRLFNADEAFSLAAEGFHNFTKYTQAEAIHSLLLKGEK